MLAFSSVQSDSGRNSLKNLGTRPTQTSVLMQIPNCENRYGVKNADRPRKTGLDGIRSQELPAEADCPASPSAGLGIPSAVLREALPPISPRNARENAGQRLHPMNYEEKVFLLLRCPQGLPKTVPLLAKKKGSRREEMKIKKCSKAGRKRKKRSQ